MDDLKQETHFLGDMNIHYYCDTTPKKSFDNQKWCDVVNKYGYLKLVETLTRLSRTKLSIIDHIYTNKRLSVLEINVPVFAVSDHLPVCLNRFAGVHRDVNKHNTISYRAFKAFKSRRVSK